MPSQVSCPRCGHPKSDYISQLQDDEAAFIYEETRRIDDLLGGLHEERARLLCRLNMIRSSTRTLPNEILSDIFQLAFPSFDLEKLPPGSSDERSDPQLPIILCAVSSHWRAVAWATPKLWETVGLEVSVKNVRSTTSISQAYMTNVDRLQTSIALDFLKQQWTLYKRAHGHTKWLSQSDEIMKPVKDVLFSSGNAGKIQSIHLHSPPPGWLGAVLQNCSGLRGLSLSWSSWPIERPSWYPGVAPSNGVFNRDLRLHLEGRYEIRSPLTTITVLNLQFVPIDICFNLLIHCPNLIHYSCLHPWGVPVNSKKPRKAKVDFLSLRTLKWALGIDQWSYHLLQSLRFPALQHLAWAGYRDDRFWACFNKFSSALPATLNTLELHEDGVVAADLLHTASSCYPHLSRLVCTDCNLVIPPPIFDTLRDATQFPALRVLTVQNTRSPEAFKIPLDFLRIMEDRKEGGLQGFTFEAIGVKIYWPPTIQRGLKRLIRDGFELDILHDSTQVEWLSQE